VLPRTLRNPAPRGSAPWIPNCDSWCRCRALRLTLSGEVAGAVPHASRLAIWGPMYGGGEVRCRTNPFAVSSSNRESPCRRRIVSSGTYRKAPIVRCQFCGGGVALLTTILHNHWRRECPMLDAAQLFHFCASPARRDDLVRGVGGGAQERHTQRPRASGNVMCRKLGKRVSAFSQ